MPSLTQQQAGAALGGAQRERTKADVVNSALEGLASAVASLEGFVLVNVTGDDTPPKAEGRPVGYADGPALEVFLSALPSRIAELEKRVHECRVRLHDALVREQPKPEDQLREQYPGLVINREEVERQRNEALRRTMPGGYPDPGCIGGGPAHG